MQDALQVVLEDLEVGLLVGHEVLGSGFEGVGSVWFKGGSYMGWEEGEVEDSPKRKWSSYHITSMEIDKVFYFRSNTLNPFWLAAMTRYMHLLTLGSNLYLYGLILVE